MKYLLLPLMLGSLAFSACDSKEASETKAADKNEAKAIEKQADAVRATGDAEADKVKAEAAAKAKAMDNAADAKKEEAKATPTPPNP